MTDDNCIFCKIAGGVIPSTTLYEDEDFRVILDLGPASRGHALILPKQHFADVCVTGWGYSRQGTSSGCQDWLCDEEISWMRGIQSGSE